MIVHMWNRFLDGTICGDDSSRHGVTLDRENATCEKCIRAFDKETEELTVTQSKIRNLKETAMILQQKMDKLQPCSDSLNAVLSMIKDL